MSTAARWRWGILWDARARSSPQPSCMKWNAATCAMAWSQCASAAVWALREFSSAWRNEAKAKGVLRFALDDAAGRLAAQKATTKPTTKATAAGPMLTASTRLYRNCVAPSVGRACEDGSGRRRTACAAGYSTAAALRDFLRVRGEKQLVGAVGALHAFLDRNCAVGIRDRLALQRHLHFSLFELRHENQLVAVPVAGAHHALRKCVAEDVAFVNVIGFVPVRHFVADLLSLGRHLVEIGDL